ncbi:MAG: twin-arginine translocation signal domain-containing protein [Candidatus Hydrogenedentes bacterium]|nr:twin-arginine translocation signal domain-containing protein [Candidatus Hydrogenedentota bacterium]
MENTRRDFLKTASAVAAAGTVIAAPLAVPAQAAAAVATAGAVTEHKLPPLPYDYNALEPFIDAETMTLHHDKHHAAYVKGLNEAETKLAEARASGDHALVQHWSRKVAFNGGGHYLHSMFWTIMAPAGKGGGGEPSGPLADKIKEDFGSFAAFKAQFSAAAKGVEGSGWGLLHHRVTDGRLIVMQAENQQKLTSWDCVPILGVDVWEHAYYVKYRNDRAAYVDAWWNVVNWEQVAKNYMPHGAPSA